MRIKNKPIIILTIYLIIFFWYPTNMSLKQLLSHWRADPSIASNIVNWQTIPARPAKFTPIPQDIHPSLSTALHNQGIDQLYTHQTESWQHSSQGENVVVVTGTASGKTLAYNLPVLDRLIRIPEGRALYLFPTKALAQDQKNELENFNLQIPPELRVPVATYDGDTKQTERPKIRKNARLIISNPDMLHTGILPHHTKWEDFFRNLQYIVIDEMHTYRGVFGSHVANVMRRLKRITQFYGSSPQFILTSATIANPRELANGLIEKKTHLVDQDGAPRGEKHFLFYNPPITNEELGIRRSVMQESVRLVNDLLTYNIQTILFGKARRSVEVMLNYLRESAPIPPNQIRGYRSGYLPRQRREIEKGLREGDVKAVVTTSALELGIDIGSMDAAVLAGYPGSISGTWQQAGRAGRKEDASLSILATSANPLDQFLAHHPGFFFERSPEQALINPNNLLILLGHLRCAAFELPFHADEGFGEVPGEEVAEFLHLLEEGQEVHQSNGKYFWMADDYPATAISLRSASPNVIVLHAQTDDGWRIVGKVDSASADWMVHPEAIYMHEGQSYIVDELDLTQNLAYLSPAKVDYYTMPLRESNVGLLNQIDQVSGEKVTKTYGELSIITKVTGYQRIEWHTHQRLGNGKVDLPEKELQTTGYWLTIEDEILDILREKGLWNNDPNDYGPEWARLAETIRKRDAYTCQNCGAVEEGRKHDVHHNIPLRAFNSLVEANRPENLTTLCQPCHHRAEVVVKMRSGLSGLAFTLGHLAPLFLMCDSSDLGVHADPQSKLADGKPVVVLFDQIPAGIGFSERLFELHDEILLRAHQLISSCECLDGCPSCVGPGGEQGKGAKSETLALLEELI
ncbi:MAG: DEAD/DEAH box helicase [Chloroflexi bacterium]|nr:DEAD/DEAH box helicase [Chloroflexota bacterium]